MNLQIPLLSTLAPSMQRSVTITVGALVACLLIVFLGALPQQQELQKTLLESTALKTTLSLMRADIAATATVKTQIADANSRQDALVASGVIEPLLGSFAMRGKALLDPVAQETGFRIESVKELTLIPLQLPKPAPEQTYARQPIEFTGLGGYTQIVAFIARAEDAQPLATLSGLSIRCQQQTPETHKAIITFEWPIKGEKIKPVSPAPTK
jgi:Tfp pilus assembly protein PilO